MVVAGSKSDAVSKRIECGVIMKSEKCCKILRGKRLRGNYLEGGDNSFFRDLCSSGDSSGDSEGNGGGWKEHGAFVAQGESGKMVASGKVVVQKNRSGIINPINHTKSSFIGITPPSYQR